MHYTPDARMYCSSSEDGCIKVMESYTLSQVIYNDTLILAIYRVTVKSIFANDQYSLIVQSSIIVTALLEISSDLQF